MKHLSSSLACLLALLVLAGCNLSPRAKIGSAYDTYTATARASAIAVRADLIPVEALDALDTASDEAKRAIDDANRQRIDDKPIDLNYWIDRALDAVQRYADVLADVKGASSD